MAPINTLTYINRRNAVATGICFILAAVTSIAGKLLYAPVLANPEYLTISIVQANGVILGAVFELMLAVTAIGTGLFMYPFLRAVNESLGLGYVFFRALEVVFILIGLVSVLALISLSKAFIGASQPDIGHFESVGATLRGIHGWTFILGPNFMLGVNTILYSYVFLVSRLLPKPIALLGLTAAALILAVSLLELFGIVQQVSAMGFLLAFPIFLYEMTVAVWLIRRGFNLSCLQPNVLS
ncbi:DUF4386 domain-containing protein [Spirosoma montaniterrae]|uniref:DUF4386 domain-containing protein n=1 Tax=Spirosoma montaniterrae TaxID=1178516 RepID=A0A1P9WUX4_9BACT|nr:DUF4386 domain-containing protein [Spirosoma montaniterrae]AQG79196.1 hypothetical protein AWR27_07580 [Spirosoma montaniterrae]